MASRENHRHIAQRHGKTSSERNNAASSGDISIMVRNIHWHRASGTGIAHQYQHHGARALGIMANKTLRSSRYRASRAP